MHVLLQLLQQLRAISEKEENLQPHKKDGGVDGLEEGIEKRGLAAFEDAVAHKLRDPRQRVKRDRERGAADEVLGSDLVHAEHDGEVQQRGNGLHEEEGDGVDGPQHVGDGDGREGERADEGAGVDGGVGEAGLDLEEREEVDGRREDGRDADDVDEDVAPLAVVRSVEGERFLDVEVG